MLKDMGTRFDRHLIDMEEKDVKFRMRLDELQEQLVELKERSPGTSPKSSHPTSPQGSASPNIRPPSYLIIMGGWKEGERKDYLDVQLPKLFAAAGVSQHVKEVQLFGKRPRCAKISLKFENDEQNGKRDLQQSVISKLRGQQWTPQSCDKPVWVTQDRTPAQRATNKAVAIIGGFLQSAMNVTRESFEIDHWQAARTYVGDHRISGAYPGPVSSPPPRPDQFVVWPVQDHASGVSVWCDLQGVAKFVRMDPMEVKKMWDHYVVPRWHGLQATSVSTLGTGNHSLNSHLVQLGTWNVQGKALDEVMSFLDAYRLDFMVAGFQEVTATTLVGCRPEFIDFHDSGMRALLAKPTGCFRACGILLDLDYVSELGRVAVGHSHIRACVKLVGWTQPVCIVCVPICLTAVGPVGRFMIWKMHFSLCKKICNLRLIVWCPLFSWVTWMFPWLILSRTAHIWFVLLWMGLGYIISLTARILPVIPHLGGLIILFILLPFCLLVSRSLLMLICHGLLNATDGMPKTAWGLIMFWCRMICWFRCEFPSLAGGMCSFVL